MPLLDSDILARITHRSIIINLYINSNHSAHSQPMPSKSVLVTGCSAGGIGSAIALVLAKEGHHIFATARNTSKISEELSTLSNVTVLSLDVTSQPSVIAAAKAVTESGHGLDVLVNNAGAGYVTPILDMDIERAQRLYDTNLWGSIRTIQAFADLLIASRGRIINISSMGCTMNMPWLCRCPFSYIYMVALTHIRSCIYLVKSCADTHFRDVTD
jgi:NADP-dependent 3-hydroxy acid dehydrogenase YdfG